MTGSWPDVTELLCRSRKSASWKNKPLRLLKLIISPIHHYIMKGYSPINLFLFFLLSLCVKGIEVTPDSTCSAICVDQPGASTNTSDYNSSTTSPDDLVCKDSEFKGSNATASGRKWVQCLSYEAGSPAENPGYQGDNETDVFWFLYKLLVPFPV